MKLAKIVEKKVDIFGNGSTQRKIKTLVKITDVSESVCVICLKKQNGYKEKGQEG